MTIEVRQLLIKAQVHTVPSQPRAPEWSEQDREQVKEEVLAACKSWLAQQLQDRHER